MDYQKAIETVQDIHDVAETRIKSGDARGVVYINPNRLTDLKDAISAMQELQAIHNNGISIERLKDIDFRKQVVEHINYMEYMDIKDELEEYKRLGTPEEVRKAVERNKEKKVIEMVHGVHGIFDMGKSYNCPTCGSGLRYRYSVSEPIDNYCAICGQRIGWSGEDD